MKPITKKRPKLESDEENEDPSEAPSLGEASGLSDTPPSSKKQKKASTKKSATDQYQKLTQYVESTQAHTRYLANLPLPRQPLPSPR